MQNQTPGLKKIAEGLLSVLRGRDGVPVWECAIALQCERNTVRSSADRLKAAGLIVTDSMGWIVLTDSGDALAYGVASGAFRLTEIP